jgi:hypothetical protein
VKSQQALERESEVSPSLLATSGDVGAEVRVKREEGRAESIDHASESA